MCREQLHHLSGAYVLNALDDDERRAFEACLREWDDMRSEVTELADTAAALAAGVQPATPSPAVKVQLMELIARTPQLSGTGAPHRAPRRRGRVQRRGDAGAPRLLVASAALVVGVLLLATGIGLQLLAAPAPVSLARIENAEDARRAPVPLPGADAVELVWSAELDAAALTWESLPPLPEGRAYQAWYVGDAPRPAGLLDPGAPHSSLVLEGRMGPDEAVAITVEPSGGSPQPTSQPVAVVQPT